ncbi:67 kDa myosin-cross-reactive antigen family protein [Aspergillus steynii IBT 23096]|uniref:67 kDa myosin-cross-reactive antigen family protein n=1 Tax=Aspergillus steynii IBT 23096 TaxID=1392250 RepID=A0A2I2FWR8_9EURO|nr:67 kDa myosin-cross-reactive antigen family protein [Aspergillus steynii IBT 23096]PLB45065.1 67 kDa myosin-cross-reactive antigen family protein [Aspergillus steynii IBT 23096]
MLVSTIWNDPWKRIAASAGLVATYLVIVASLRFQRLRYIKRQYHKYSRRSDMSSMTIHDAWAIQKHMLQLEFPTAALKALQFALFRTYGIPTISSLLLKTSQFANPSTSFKRYADTGALIGQFMAFEPTSDRAITAIARTKFLHTGYRASGSILEDDILYTLSLFALEPIRFVGMFEWRRMSELERCAIGTYWKYIGDALGISYAGLPSGKTGFRDGLHFLDEMGEWSRRYEEENMKPSTVNRDVADRTMDILVYPLPRVLRTFGVRIASCSMDERLREAMMYERPSWIYRFIFSSLMDMRKFFLRYLSLPRPYFLRSDVFTDQPNEYGRFYVRVWVAAPYYVQPTFLNRWGPGAWVSRMLGLPLPGDEGDKYYPNGYDTADLGPKYFEGRGRKTEARVPPNRVHILEALSVAGGSTANGGDAENGYEYRTGAMPAFNDVCVEDLLSLVPSKSREGKTALDDILEYDDVHPLEEGPGTRFLVQKSKGLGRIETKRVSLGLRDRMDLFMLASKTEKSLGRSRIQEYFSESFFRSNFWLLLATTFGFQPWHSAAEFRRYVGRFMHDIHELNTPRPIDRGHFNRHDAITSPVAHFLESRGVDFRFHTKVTDIIMEPHNECGRVSAIKYTRDQQPEQIITLGGNDIAIVSLGSVMSGATTGTNISPPSLELMEIEKDLDENWLLWLELSTKHPKFGNAYNFCTRMQESRLETFTVTLRSDTFFKSFVDLTGDQPGSTSFVTLKDSAWLISLSVPNQPLFPDQPAHIQVFWGYALHPDKEGDIVKKPMLNCSGEEIMTELLHHLRFPTEEIIPESITIPCVVPRMTATLLPRASEDRPQVIPERMTNLGLIGQFVDIDEEVVVTTDYGVRGAQMAVYRLMGMDREMRKSKRSSAINLLGLL